MSPRTSARRAFSERNDSGRAIVLLEVTIVNKANRKPNTLMYITG